ESGVTYSLRPFAFALPRSQTPVWERSSRNSVSRPHPIRGRNSVSEPGVPKQEFGNQRRSGCERRRSKTLVRCRVGNRSVQELAEFVQGRAERVVVGQGENLQMLLLALLCGGHILLEGVPGTAKTLMARTLARLIHIDCKRVQFTPDLMPSD